MQLDMLTLARTNPFFRSQIEQFYTEPMLRQWIKRAQAGMKTRKGQLARWETILFTLETLRKEKTDEATLGTKTDGGFDFAGMCSD